MTEVHNLNNTTDRKPPYGYTTWREWWKAKKGRKFGTCSCQGCASSAEVGLMFKSVIPQIESGILYRFVKAVMGNPAVKLLM